MTEKTEQPTPKKLRDARNDGQVAHSKEVVSGFLLVAFVAFFMVFSEFFFDQFTRMMTLPSALYGMPFDKALSMLSEQLFDIAIAILVPIISLVVLVGIGANVMQVGFLMSFKSITPNLNKINPAEGIKKIFSKKSLFEVLKSIVKIVFLGILIWIVLAKNLEDLFKLPECGIDCVWPFFTSVFKSLMIYSCVAFIIVAAIDFTFQKSQHIKQLMMSRDEVEREFKETEGNPEIKSKRKQLHKEMLNEEIKPRVENSSAIIVNPTHVAVGIFYKKDIVDLPVITVMGTDAQALRIKSIAKDADIPIIENIPLARGLLAACDVEDYIPSEFIQPVAEVLKWVKNLELANNPEV